MTNLPTKFGELRSKRSQDIVWIRLGLRIDRPPLAKLSNNMFPLRWRGHNNLTEKTLTQNHIVTMSNDKSDFLSGV
jgi:hypothetical protein